MGKLTQIKRIYKKSIVLILMLSSQGIAKERETKDIKTATKYASPYIVPRSNSAFTVFRVDDPLVANWEKTTSKGQGYSSDEPESAFNVRLLVRPAMFIYALRTESFIPIVLTSNPSLELSLKEWPRGRYVRVGGLATQLAVKLPQVAADYIVSKTGPYFFSGREGETYKIAPGGFHIAQDHSLTRLIVGGKSIYPTMWVDNSKRPDGLNQNDIPVLRPFEKDTPKRLEMLKDSMAMIFYFPYNGTEKIKRFQLDQAPVKFEGVTIPLPLYQFEPFDIRKNEFVK
jgi:hypothetical protein